MHGRRGLELRGTLNPLDRESQLFWEYLNYGLPLLGLLLIALIRKQTNKRAAARYGAVLGMTEKAGLN